MRHNFLDPTLVHISPNNRISGISETCFARRSMESDGRRTTSVWLVWWATSNTNNPPRLLARPSIRSLTSIQWNPIAIAMFSWLLEEWDRAIWSSSQNIYAATPVSMEGACQILVGHELHYWRSRQQKYIRQPEIFKSLFWWYRRHIGS